MIGRPNDADSYSQLYGRFYIGELIIWKHRLLDYEVMHAYKSSGTMQSPSTTDLFKVPHWSFDVLLLLVIITLMINMINMIHEILFKTHTQL